MIMMTPLEWYAFGVASAWVPSVVAVLILVVHARRHPINNPPSRKARFECIACGSSIERDASYCSRCGGPVAFSAPRLTPLQIAGLRHALCREQHQQKIAVTYERVPDFQGKCERAIVFSRTLTAKEIEQLRKAAALMPGRNDE